MFMIAALICIADNKGLCGNGHNEAFRSHQLLKCRPGVVVCVCKRKGGREREISFVWHLLSSLDFKERKHRQRKERNRRLR